MLSNPQQTEINAYDVAKIVYIILFRILNQSYLVFEVKGPNKAPPSHCRVYMCSL